MKPGGMDCESLVLLGGEIKDPRLITPVPIMDLLRKWQKELIACHLPVQGLRSASIRDRDEMKKSRISEISFTVLREFSRGFFPWIIENVPKGSMPLGSIDLWIKACGIPRRYIWLCKEDRKIVDCEGLIFVTVSFFETTASLGSRVRYGMKISIECFLREENYSSLYKFFVATGQLSNWKILLCILVRGFAGFESCEQSKRH